MNDTLSTKEKLVQALRIDRSVRLVWRASPWWMIINILLVSIRGVLPLAILYIMKLIVDVLSEGVHAPSPMDAFVPGITFIALAGGVSLLSAVVDQLAGYTRLAQSTAVRDYVYAAIHEKSIEVDLAYYENSEFYNTLHWAQQEGPHRPQMIVGGLTSVGQNLITLVAMVGLLATLHYSVGLILLVAALPGVAVRLRYSGKLYEWNEKRTGERRRESYFNHVLTMDSCAKEVRLYGIGEYFSQRFSSIRRRLRSEYLGMARQQRLAECLASAFGVLVLTGCFCLVAYKTLSGTITLGDMVMYFQAFQRGLSSLRGVLNSLAALYEDNLFVSYLFRFFELSPSVQDPAEPRPVVDNQMAEVKVENVSFVYPGQTLPVLHNISMTIGAGEVIALVGENGAGKSTLVKLLCRLYDPNSGSICLNGVDYRQMAQEDLRRHISTVFQDYVRYQLPAGENIRLGDLSKEQDSPEIEEAAKKAGIANVIAGLPQGFATLLGRQFEGGQELSIGEWQKVALSRAFLRRGQLIILDEPASAMDPDAEFQMFSRFRELIAGHTALLISHRLSAVRLADRIYVLSGGTIVESGTHLELMRRQGIYADMFAKQAGSYGMVQEN